MSDVALGVAAQLIDVAEHRGQLTRAMTEAVLGARRELQTDGHPVTARSHCRDPLVRLQTAHDRLLILEMQASTIVCDLRGLLLGRAAGALDRPFGFTAEQAHDMLARMSSVYRKPVLEELTEAARSLRHKLRPETAAHLSLALTRLAREEKASAVRRAALEELIRQATKNSPQATLRTNPR